MLYSGWWLMLINCSTDYRLIKSIYWPEWEFQLTSTIAHIAVRIEFRTDIDTVEWLMRLPFQFPPRLRSTQLQTWLMQPRDGGYRLHVGVFNVYCFRRPVRSCFYTAGFQSVTFDSGEGYNYDRWRSFIRVQCTLWTDFDQTSESINYRPIWKRADFEFDPTEWVRGGYTYFTPDVGLTWLIIPFDIERPNLAL